MEEKIKNRIEGLEKRIEIIEKRFEDLKKYFVNFSAPFAIIVSASMLVFSWNYNSERTSIREFLKEVKSELR